MIPENLTLRPNTKDKESVQQIFVQEQYAPLKGIENVKLIVDCGAYIGLASYYLATEYPKAEIIALEPDKLSYEQALTNISEHPSRTKITVYNLAVWPYPTAVYLERCERSWATQVTEATNKDKTFAITLNQIQSMYDVIDILKVDIEGSEKYVFAENTQWLNYTRNIAIELHDEQDRAVFFNTMKKYSYDLSFHGELTVCKNIERKNEVKFRLFA